MVSPDDPVNFSLHNRGRTAIEGRHWDGHNTKGDPPSFGLKRPKRWSIFGADHEPRAPGEAIPIWGRAPNNGLSKPKEIGIEGRKISKPGASSSKKNDKETGDILPPPKTFRVPLPRWRSHSKYRIGPHFPRDSVHLRCALTRRFSAPLGEAPPSPGSARRAPFPKIFPQHPATISRAHQKGETMFVF